MNRSGFLLTQDFFLTQDYRFVFTDTNSRSEIKLFEGLVVMHVEHRIQKIERRTQNAKHRAKNTEHGLRALFKDIFKHCL